ncbi:MAG TPA: tripartite tricarboxylate transporter substrate binding protein [Usitatibacter sp.]
MRARTVLCAGFAALLALAGDAAAQGHFPSRPITIVVGFAAGGATDTAARIIARKLSENMGVSVVVDNRAGAGGNIAHQQVANAAPDGYTILLGSVGPLTVAPHLVKDLPYDPQKDLAPLTMGVMFPNILVVNPSVPAKTLQEFVALARDKPGTLEYGSTGIGSAAHLAGELLKQRAKIDLTHVPYKGGGPAMPDILGGRIASYWSPPSTALPYIQSGKLRALASTGTTRSPVLPDVPTVAESGFPGFEASNWYAFVAPGKTPPEILDRWNAELVKVLNAPDIREQLLQHGLEPRPGTREELAAYIRKETETWGKVIRAANIKAD